MTMYLARTAIVLIGGSLYLANIALLLVSIIRPDPIWAVLCGFNAVVMPEMMRDLWVWSKR